MNRLCVLTMLLLASIAAARWNVDLEAGPVFSGYNDVRIPGDSGTLFSLVDDFDAQVALGFRARVSKTFGDRHWVSAMFAPLRVWSQGSSGRDLSFAGRQFSAGSDLFALYRFDSYRLTYRYGLVRTRLFRFDVGLTAKVRDAEISLEYRTVMLPGAKKTNTGFVPLVSFLAQWQFAPRVGLVLDGDALGVPQGRAEDVTAALQFGIGNRVDIRIGYRVLEGGSDVDEVYGFALFHYAVAGVTLWL